ncbi:MAG: hypothetical protein J0H06_09795 [Actinobacteria bacterium]|nr:hypothetical protein [Actinomycetota bacterium]OJU86287.1 MAG: hypothetical protein BGO11_02645 [Solirubrobacterales bacterium 70-9]
MTASSIPINAPPPDRVAHAALRGAVAAMAMTGMRVLTTELGLVEEPPPQAIFRQKARGLLRLVPRQRRRAAIELAHWGYGAGGGAAFGTLPEEVRKRAWAGPVYGLAVWAGFEMALAPLLGLEQAHQKRPTERVSLALDHLLYGFILSELRSRPRD